MEKTVSSFLVNVSNKQRQKSITDARDTCIKKKLSKETFKMFSKLKFIKYNFSYLDFQMK